MRSSSANRRSSRCAARGVARILGVSRSSSTPVRSASHSRAPSKSRPSVSITAREDIAARPAAEAVVELLDAGRYRTTASAPRGTGTGPVAGSCPHRRSSVRAPTRSAKSTASRTFSLDSLGVPGHALSDEALRHEPLGPGADREAVGHARQIVDHPVPRPSAFDPGSGMSSGRAQYQSNSPRSTRSIFACSARACGPRYTRSNMNARSAHHRRAHHVRPARCRPRARSARRGRGPACRSAAEPVSPQHGDLLAREIVDREHAGPQRIVDVVVDVGDPVDQPDDLALERRRLAGAARSGAGSRRAPPRSGSAPPARRPRAASARCGGTRPRSVAPAGVQHVLADVPEGWVPDVMAEADRLHQVLVEPQRARHGPRDLRRLQRVREPRPVVVALRRDEHLRLVLELRNAFECTIRSRSRWNGVRSEHSSSAHAHRRIRRGGQGRELGLEQHPSIVTAVGGRSGSAVQSCRKDPPIAPAMKVLVGRNIEGGAVLRRPRRHVVRGAEAAGEQRRHQADQEERRHGREDQERVVDGPGLRRRAACRGQRIPVRPVPTRPAAPKGETGARGAHGTNGTNGTNGVDGAKGDKGDTGTSFTFQRMPDATSANDSTSPKTVTVNRPAGMLAVGGAPSPIRAAPRRSASRPITKRTPAAVTPAGRSPRTRPAATLWATGRSPRR